MAADTRPNVLFLMADQHRHDVLGAVNPTAITPNLDKLAAEGVRFKHAYSSTPTCTPARFVAAAERARVQPVRVQRYPAHARPLPCWVRGMYRAAVLTGLSPWYHGMLGYGVVADRYPFEMPRALSAAGYATHSIGKDHFGWNKTANAGIPHGYSTTNLCVPRHQHRPLAAPCVRRGAPRGRPGVPRRCRRCARR